ncbi:hypothetical protein LTS18_004511 [Coniosporium uncinatum]|uniref:Uncharacterized protein n=1 Tax=Coniosporium uncinatum TaxID=93489 RepID=A0ACC3DBS8_9PEZI|nr:hypothetical protein LTS18_004511 [Coniosporium uncinatum]
MDLDGDLDQVVEAVKAWLDLPKNKRWLIIYDNYDNPKLPGDAEGSTVTVDVLQFLPRSDHGSVVITTRSSQVRLGHRIHVQKLPSVQDGLEVLSNTSGRKGIQDDLDAIALVKELDGLPLALSIAGAYLEHTGPFGSKFGSRGYSVHSCVHAWMVFVLNKKWDKSMAILALTCVAAEVPSADKKDWWLLERRLLRHVTRQGHLVVEDKVDLEGLDWVSHELGRLYANQDKLAQAEVMFIRALQGKEEALGPDHTSTLDTVNNLGILYKNQGKLAEAEKMYARALQGYVNALGPELVSSYLPALNTMSAFGDLFSQTDRKDMAKAMYNRALSGYTTVQGPSSERCSEIEGRLQALQIMPGETETQHKPTEAKPLGTKSRLQRIFRRLKA